MSEDYRGPASMTTKPGGRRRHAIIGAVAFPSCRDLILLAAAVGIVAMSLMPETAPVKVGDK